MVERRAHVDRSIVWRNSYIGSHSEIRGSLLGVECNVKANAVIFENAVVADRSIVGRGAIIQPNVKIWPNKEIESGAVVSTSIIWGAAGRRVLFGRRGVSGLTCRLHAGFTGEAGFGVRLDPAAGRGCHAKPRPCRAVTHAEAGAGIGMHRQARVLDLLSSGSNPGGPILHLRFRGCRRRPCTHLLIRPCRLPHCLLRQNRNGPG